MLYSMGELIMTREELIETLLEKAREAKAHDFTRTDVQRYARAGENRYKITPEQFQKLARGPVEMTPKVRKRWVKRTKKRRTPSSNSF